jgi:hypothetical protein
MNMQGIDAGELLKKILGLDLRKYEVSVALASARQNSDIPLFRRVNISPAMAKVFCDAIDAALKPFKEGTSDGNIMVRDFSVGTGDSDSEVEHLDLTDFESIVQQIAPLDDYKGLPSFEQKEVAFVQGLRFHVITVDGALPHPINFYRKYTRTQLLSESSLFGMRWHEDLYDQVTEPTFLFDRHIDCISYEKHMFVLSKSNFYTIFRFLEALEEAGRLTLKELALKDFIHPFERFERDCLNNKMKLLKLKNISMQPYLSTITVDDAERTIRDYGLEIQLKKFGGKKKMLYDPKKPWEILHLLDDAYLDSAMTSASYHAKGKRGVRKK